MGLNLRRRQDLEEARALSETAVSLTARWQSEVGEIGSLSSIFRKHGGKDDTPYRYRTASRQIMFFGSTCKSRYCRLQAHPWFRSREALGNLGMSSNRADPGRPNCQGDIGSTSNRRHLPHSGHVSSGFGSCNGQRLGRGGGPNRRQFFPASRRSSSLKIPACTQRIRLTTAFSCGESYGSSWTTAQFAKFFQAILLSKTVLGTHGEIEAINRRLSFSF